MEEIITEDYLNANPNFIFVFGDNLKRVGCGGAAKLRHLPNTYGFITKKAPSNKDEDYYKPEEYHDIFMDEVDKLHEEIFNNPDKIYLISKLGSGLANKYKIWECLISVYIEVFSEYENVRLLFKN